MIKISFYGFVYALGFLIIFLILQRYLKYKNKNQELAFSGLIYFIVGILIGSRIFYGLFYSLDYFLKNPLNIFYFWNGGLSFHGGLLGLIIANYIFCKKNNLDFLELSDIIAITGSFFLVLGRIANFFNGEILGKIKNFQIYLSIKNLFIFSFLIYLKKYCRVKKGRIFFSFLLLYSLLRFFVDFFRVYENVYFGLGTGQYLSLVMFFVSIFFFFKINRQ